MPMILENPELKFSLDLNQILWCLIWNSLIYQLHFVIKTIKSHQNQTWRIPSQLWKLDSFPRWTNFFRFEQIFLYSHGNVQWNSRIWILDFLKTNDASLSSSISFLSAVCLAVWDYLWKQGRTISRSSPENFLHQNLCSTACKSTSSCVISSLANQKVLRKEFGRKISLHVWFMQLSSCWESHTAEHSRELFELSHARHTESSKFGK